MDARDVRDYISKMIVGADTLKVCNTFTVIGNPNENHPQCINIKGKNGRSFVISVTEQTA